jgi:hypothetical protein
MEVSLNIHSSLLDYSLVPLLNSLEAPRPAWKGHTALPSFSSFIQELLLVFWWTNSFQIPSLIACDLEAAGFSSTAVTIL